MEKISKEALEKVSKKNPKGTRLPTAQVKHTTKMQGSMQKGTKKLGKKV